MLNFLRIFCVSLLLNLLAPHPSMAADDALFTINVDVANVRNGPSRSTRVVETASAGQVFYALGRNTDSDWLRVSADRNTSPDTWIFASLGVLSIDIERLPIVTQSPPQSTIAAMATPTPIARAARPAVAASYYPANAPVGLPSLSARARQIYAQGLAYGRSAQMFMIAGDSNSEHPQFFDRVSLGWYGLASYPNLPNILARWDAGARRQDANASVSVRGGLSAAKMVMPFSHPSCASGESRFICELRLSNASVVFIQLGTGDKFAWREFENNSPIHLTNRVG